MTSHRDLLREVAPELATPHATSLTAPSLRVWYLKQAITVSIPNTNPPNSLDDLMPIPYKILERIIAKEL